MLASDEARLLLDSIDTSSLLGLRDRALIGLMTYTFARVGAALGMWVEDYYVQGRRGWVRLHEKGGKEHTTPTHHNLDQYLHEYIAAAGLAENRKAPLFRAARGRSGELGPNVLGQPASRPKSATTPRVEEQAARSGEVVFPALIEPAPVTGRFQQFRIGIVPTGTPGRVRGFGIGYVGQTSTETGCVFVRSLLAFLPRKLVTKERPAGVRAVVWKIHGYGTRHGIALSYLDRSFTRTPRLHRFQTLVFHRYPPLS